MILFSILNLVVGLHNVAGFYFFVLASNSGDLDAEHGLSWGLPQIPVNMSFHCGMWTSEWVNLKVVVVYVIHVGYLA